MIKIKFSNQKIKTNVVNKHLIDQTWLNQFKGLYNKSLYFLKFGAIFYIVIYNFTNYQFFI